MTSLLHTHVYSENIFILYQLCSIIVSFVTMWYTTISRLIVSYATTGLLIVSYATISNTIVTYATISILTIVPVLFQ